MRLPFSKTTFYVSAFFWILMLGGSHRLGACPIQEQEIETIQSIGDLDLTKPSDDVYVIERELSPEDKGRKSAIAKCLAIYYTRQVDADVLRPWSIMHGLIGYGEETMIVARGRRYSATEYLCANGIGDDRRILFTRNGQLDTHVGSGVQGHEAQLLAILAQANVSSDVALNVDGQEFTVQDLVEKEMKDCRSDSELTFRLLGLSYYVDSDETWTSNQGQQWSLSRLLKEELAEEINEGACGGTHRLMAVSYALAQRRAENKPIDGHWRQAEKFIREFQDSVWYFQGKSGSFSTRWFADKRFSGNAEKKLYSTGHILEWLVFSLPEDELKNPRVTRSVDFILNLMLTAPDYDLAVGPRGHALHALRMYEQKVFEKSDYTRYMKNRQLVSNNPQNGGGSSRSGESSSSQSNRTFRAGWRRSRFGRR